MRTRYLIASGLAALALTAAGCGDGGEKTASYTVDAPPSSSAEPASDAPAPAAAKDEPKVRVPAGDPPKQLETRDIKEGTGPAAKKGDAVLMNYVGVAYSTKKKFDSSYDGDPLPVTLGEGGVIAGWDEGIPGMKVGGRRELIIPPGKAYGAQGFPPDIGPDETLVFIVDLVEIQ
jgi:peptidylprolyl isomerase